MDRFGRFRSNPRALVPEAGRAWTWVLAAGAERRHEYLRGREIVRCRGAVHPGDGRALREESRELCRRSRPDATGSDWMRSAAHPCAPIDGRRAHKPLPKADAGATLMTLESWGRRQRGPALGSAAASSGPGSSGVRARRPAPQLSGRSNTRAGYMWTRAVKSVAISSSRELVTPCGDAESRGSGCRRPGARAEWPLPVAIGT